MPSNKHILWLLVLTILIYFISAVTVSPQQNAFPPAPIRNDDGGTVVITGEVNYTNPFFTSGVTSPMIILEDQAGFVDRNRAFIFPIESQTIGQITSDFFTSPFSYSIALPIEPQGTLRDVDNDATTDTGVMIFAVAYWNNTWGDPFLEVRDQSGGGWSTAYASTRVSTDPQQQGEVFGGKLLVFSPDDEQGFPTGFGDDRLLFTADDPIIGLPSGYTLVDMNSEPFMFDRSRNPVVDLIEPDTSSLVDFSDLSFTDAFDSMVEKFRTEYAFTDNKNLDWDALSAEFRPRFKDADVNQDNALYLEALRDFISRIPDGHVNVSPFSRFRDEYLSDVALGVGMSIQETDDGRSLVVFVLPGGPAAIAGILQQAEILEINGKPIAEVISAVEPWTQPFSTPHNLRLEQQRFVLRFNENTESVDITYRNPGDVEATNTTLPTIPETTTLTSFVPQQPVDGLELPVEFGIFDNGYGFASIYSFLDNAVLTVQIWERMIQQMSDANVPGLIIDMRQNGGGSGFLADQLAAYFFNEEQIVGYRGYYIEELGGFFIDEETASRMYPPDESLRFDGAVAVLIGPNCASACERFVYNLTLNDRAVIVGQYPTAGLGGSVEDFRMPLGMTIRFTIGRSVDAAGNIHIEGTGVAPTLRVPVDETTLFSPVDPILQYAVSHLSDESIIRSRFGGAIEVGNTIEDEFSPGERVRYLLRFSADEPLDIFAGNADNSLTTVIRIYDLSGNLLISNSDEQTENSGSSQFFDLSTPQDLAVTVEVGSFEDAEGGPFQITVTRSSDR